MIKLNILNMKDFLETVNTCKGAVNMLCHDGKWLNISRQYTIQNDLLKQYKANKNGLRLTIDIPTPKDYMNIVCYYAGDC